MDAKTQRDLALLRAERERLTRDLERIDLDMGRRADAILASDEYASKSSLGRLLGFSHTHVATLIERARAMPVPPANERIPVMENTIAGEYVMSIGASIVRSISGFSSGDVLVQSGLDPRLFAEEGEQRLDIPSMLWQLDSGEWIGVSEVTVGYGGTGPDYARHALRSAGVNRSVAAEIVQHRFCDAVNIDEPSTWFVSTRWPVHARSVPRVLGDRMVIMFGDGLASLQEFHAGLDLRREPVDETGFYASDHPETHLEAWLRFLNDRKNLPDWAQGPRTARVFRNAEAAGASGFLATTSAWGRWGNSTSPCVVIEQGKVQLWGFFYRPRDTTQYLPDEAYQVLAIADVYPTTLAERDERTARPWGRFVSTFFNVRDGLPDAIDVSVDGKGVLEFTPTEAIRY